MSAIILRNYNFVKKELKDNFNYDLELFKTSDDGELTFRVFDGEQMVVFYFGKLEFELFEECALYKKISTFLTEKFMHDKENQLKRLEKFITLEYKKNV